MLDLSQELGLGYVFYPYESLDHPGHPCMDVSILKTPADRLFDPKYVVFQVVSHTDEMIEHIHIEHPWRSGKRYRVCAGRIIISDREGKCVEAFSFGGDLQILSDAEHTVCTLESTAPIFSLYSPHDLPMWITAEAE